ncbi:MAG: MHS family MFS transporter [Comamonadaceae bacterium]|nr:MHS family MFS transporter [Comamonadaceae bacterium]
MSSKTSARPNQKWVVFLSTSVGTAIEQYDFLLFGVLAASIFSKLYFPSFDPLMGTLASMGAFAVGVAGRPIGAVIAGHFGDRVGRKSMLLVSLITMGAASTAIGLLPTYESWGIWAPILLITLRLAQGLALGAEQAGASILAVEHAPKELRGLYGSFPIIGSYLGALMAFATLAIMALISGDSFTTWGWRVPFLASSVLLVLGFAIRSRLDETPAFEALQDNKAKNPLMEVIRSSPKQLIVASFIRFGNFGFSTIIMVITLSYATTVLALPRSVILNAISIAAFLALFTVPLIGYLSDKFGRRPLIMCAALCTIFFSWPYFLILQTKDTVWITCAIVFGFAIITPLCFSVEAAFFSEMFAARTRFSGVAIGQQIGSLVAGTFIPMFAPLALAQTGGDPWPIALFSTAMGCAMALAVYLARETRGDALDPGAKLLSKRAMVS